MIPLSPLRQSPAAALGADLSRSRCSPAPRTPIRANSPRPRASKVGWETHRTMGPVRAREGLGPSPLLSNCIKTANERCLSALAPRRR